MPFQHLLENSFDLLEAHKIREAIEKVRFAWFTVLKMREPQSRIYILFINKTAANIGHGRIENLRREALGA